MLGFQARAPAEQQSNYQETSSSSNKRDESTTKPQQSLMSPLASHINLINQAKQATLDQQQQQQQQQQQHRPQHLASPGYHSGNSSPSSSAVNSPVSSSSLNSIASPSSSGPSSSSSSSGISMASHANSSAANSSSSTSPNSSSSSPASSRSPISPNLLDYYPELNQDGLALSWFHDANNRARLTAALLSNKMLISGDISLAEMSRYPVPIMARPPLGVSDITLENWLQEVTRSQPQRGIKLTFTSTRTVEPAFRVLSRHAELIKGPLILAADILASGQSAGAQLAKGAKQQQQQPTHLAAGGAQPVDAWTFLMLCRTRFPRCIISIGWCACADIDGAQSATYQLSNNTDPMFELDVGPMDVAASLGRGQAQAHLYAPVLAAKGNNKSHLMMNHQQLSQHLSQHHQILSSTGSLNSSSGNSSGSPSPTSPVGHLLMSPPTYYNQSRASSQCQAQSQSQLQSQQQQRRAHYLNQCNLNNQKSLQAIHSIDSSGSSSAGAAAAAAAAAMAAAVMAASNHFQQVPLNLNINEADQQLSSSSSSSSSLSSSSSSSSTSSTSSTSSSSSSSSSSPSLNQLAKKIQSYQTLNSLNLNNGHHIQKKAAICSTNSTNPSPQSTNINRHLNRQQANMLLKTTANNGNSNMTNSSGGYTREMIDKMANLVKEYNLTQPVTFPVEARFIKGSLAELQRLLYQVGSNSTLTIVAQQDDLINVEDLLRIRKGFATNQLLFDLPSDLADAFRQELEILND